MRPKLLFFLLSPLLSCHAHAVTDWLKILGVFENSSEKAILAARDSKLAQTADPQQRELIEEAAQTLLDPTKKQVFLLELARERTRQAAFTEFHRMYSLAKPPKEALLNLLSSVERVEAGRIGQRIRQEVAGETGAFNSIQESPEWRALRDVLTQEYDRFLAGKPTPKEILKYLNALNHARDFGPYRIVPKRYFSDMQASMHLARYLRDKTDAPKALYTRAFEDWLRDSNLSDEKTRSELAKWLSIYSQRFQAPQLELAQTLLRYRYNLSGDALEVAKVVPPREMRDWLMENVLAEVNRPGVESWRREELFKQGLERARPMLELLYQRDETLRQEDAKSGGFLGWLNKRRGTSHRCRYEFGRVAKATQPKNSNN